MAKDIFRVAYSKKLPKKKYKKWMEEFNAKFPTMKTYILQKDMPDVKAGAELKLSDNAGTIYRIIDRAPYNEMYAFKRDFVEKDDGSWFKLKEEPVRKPYVISTVFKGDNTDYPDRSKYVLVFSIGGTSADENRLFEISVERLAEILIAESKGNVRIYNGSSKEDLKIFTDTQKEYDVWKAMGASNCNPPAKKQFTEEDIVEGMKFMSANRMKRNTVEEICHGRAYMRDGGYFLKEDIAEKLNNGTFKLAE